MIVAPDKKNFELSLTLPTIPGFFYIVDMSFSTTTRGGTASSYHDYDLKTGTWTWTWTIPAEYLYRYGEITRISLVIGLIDGNNHGTQGIVLRYNGETGETGVITSKKSVVITDKVPTFGKMAFPQSK